MKILAIDTSCDDTSASIILDGKVISNVISSQINFHIEWGGVVPSLAKRLHSEKIDTVIGKALKLSSTKIEEVDYIAVTKGPGLAIALEVGVKKASELAIKYNKKLIAVDHMEGHIYSTFALNRNGKGHINSINFPYLALLVSGNHTELIIMKGHGIYEKIGEALDDAVGEAFDKSGRTIKIGYPAGRTISEFAKKGNPNAYELPTPLEKAPGMNFSYSGLKSAFNRLVGKIESEKALSKQDVYDLCAVFQDKAIGELIQQTKKALKQYKVNALILGGGVSANLSLRTRLRQILKQYNIPLYVPLNVKLCTDNAAMIGVAAYWRIKSNNACFADPYTIDRDPSMSL